MRPISTRLAEMFQKLEAQPHDYHIQKHFYTDGRVEWFVGIDWEGVGGWYKYTGSGKTPPAAANDALKEMRQDIRAKKEKARKRVRNAPGRGLRGV